ELASGHAEPYLQSGAYYLNLIRTVEDRRAGTVLPCIILYAAGPHIGFSGAAFSRKIRQDVLTPLLGTDFHHCDEDAFCILVHALRAYKNAVIALEHYYAVDLPLIQARPPAKMPQLLFPYPMAYHDTNGREVGFKYIEPMDTGTLIFRGVTDHDSRPIVIKFTHRYSKVVHDWCADHLCAPKLLACERIPGRWFMVVMESVPLHEYCNLSRQRYLLSHEQMQHVRENVEKFVSKLWEANFVHGDLRDANILVNADGTDFKVVDFDWSGAIGEARYPSNMNTVTVRRP
ncbi:uncharacterized protein LAESUDRAFT_620559, partial [Laetiporus sulphureus 93-53]